MSGTDIRAYAPLPSRQFILFPYQVDNEDAKLVPMDAIQTRWPRTAEYLQENKRRLEAREGGKFRGKDWHRFGRNQNLGIQQRVKLCVPRLIEVIGAAFDSKGTHFLDNVDVGGLTLAPAAVSHQPEFFLALLNSALIRWFFPNVSAPFRGGFRSANKQFLSQLPIRLLNLSDGAERAQHDVIVKLVSRILSAKATNTSADTSALEREIDRIIYKLYGLTEEEIAVVNDAASS